MPTVIYRPARKTPSVYSKENFDGVVLEPGENQVSKEELDTLLSNPYFNNYIGNRITEVKKETPSADAVVRKKTEGGKSMDDAS